MRKTDKIDYLSQVPMFTECNKRELGEIARHLDQVVARAGTKLTNEGSLASQFGIIVEGSATVRRNKRKLAQLGPGDFWGEMALLLKEKSSATVTTEEDSKLLVMHARDFSHLLDEVPTLARKLATGLASRLLEADRQLTV